MQQLQKQQATRRQGNATAEPEQSPRLQQRRRREQTRSSGRAANARGEGRASVREWFVCAKSSVERRCNVNPSLFLVLPARGKSAAAASALRRVPSLICVACVQPTLKRSLH